MLLRRVSKKCSCSIGSRQIIQEDRTIFGYANNDGSYRNDENWNTSSATKEQAWVLMIMLIYLHGQLVPQVTYGGEENIIFLKKVLQRTNI